MNIQVQCCGILLLLVLLFFYVRQKKLHLSTEKAFMMIFVVSLICILLDVLSVIVITHMDSLPGLLVAIVCKAYPVSLVTVAICCVRYICVDIYLVSKRLITFARIYGAIFVLGVALICILPIQYCYEPEAHKLYTYGPSIAATYAFVAFFLISVIVIMFMKKDRMNHNRREAVQIWVALWVVAAAIQGWNNNLLLVGYAGSVGIMVLYLKLENPENNLDRKTGLFNQNALGLYLRQIYAGKENFSVLSILFEESFERNISDVFNEESVFKMVNYLLQIPESNVFKNSEEEIIIIMNNKNLAEEWVPKIQQFLVKNSYEAELLFIPDAKQLTQGEDLFYLIRYVRENSTEHLEKTLTTVNDGMITKMYQEKTIKRQIQNAMDMDLVEVHYQPIYSTKEKKFTSAEALVRIRDEKGNLIPPGMFIEIAEKNGMIIRLGEIVFEKVCRFIKEHRIEQYGIHYVEVNLSVIQCADEHLADTFIRIMKKYDISPQMINLEITESASLSAKMILLDNMKCLMDYGVKFSLDDFGTGQSNLNYIVDMPVDIVKFDRGMINAYFENGKAKYVMDAAMHMIHGMELQIVSEGIETEHQYETMEDLGISYIQGYYFSKPLPEAEFLDFIANYH